MGSKGSQQTQTNQAQTYTPAPQAAGAISGALNQAYNVAQTPFSTPQAPVAGFSQDQLNAFNATNATQGYAQPYINQAANYFSPQGTQDFLNPYTQNVTANLQDVFGQQMSQATGQAVQQAGGQGADRVAVAQSELAKQQGLAAGQTYAGLYGNAAQLAQGAGFGTANLGTAGQNAQLQGIQAQLGTGGLQQQLQQAQLNSPYQQQLAQIAWPYQNSQFLSGAVGALAPGLGGTTAGAGTNTYPGASLLGSIAGLGLTGLGAYGAYNQASNSAGQSAGGGGPGSARGGRINPYAYASGGATDDSDPSMAMPTMQQTGGYDPIRYAEMSQLAAAGNPAGVNPGSQSGSMQLPSGISGAPINVAPQSEVPQTQLTPIKPNVPQLNLSTPQQSGGASGGIDWGSIAKMAGTAAMFLANRGGAVSNPYEHLDHIKNGVHRVFGRGGRNPYAEGGDVDDPNVTVIPEQNPVDNRTPQAGAGVGNVDGIQAIREELLRRYPQGPQGPQTQQPPVSIASNNDPAGAPQAIQGALQRSQQPADAAPPGDDAPLSYAPASPAAKMPTTPATDEPPPGEVQSETAMPSRASHKPGLIDSPWMALVSAGLGTLAASGQRDARGLPMPPLAAIGAGGLMGMQTLQQQRQTAQKDTTIDQEAQKLDQAVKFHNDQYTKLTAAQKATEAQTAKAEEDKYNRVPASEAAKLNEPIVVGGQLVNKKTGEVLFKGAGWSPESYEIGARQMINGDMTPIRTAGPGTQGQVARNALRNRAAEILMQEYHLTAQQAAEAISARMQAFTASGQGQSAQARALGTQEAKMGTAAFEAQGAINLANDVIDKVPRTGFLALNKLIEGYQNHTLNPDQAELFTRTQGVINAYSAVMARGASVTTDASRHRAEELLQTASDPAVYKRVLKTMQSEIDMAKNSPEKMREFYRTKYGSPALAALDQAQGVGAEPPPRAAAPAAAPAAPAPPTVAAPKGQPDAATRFNQLRKANPDMAPKAIYDKMHQEGYQVQQ